MPVIKANAYGTYINTRLNIINEFDIVAVAIVNEGVTLRRLGYKKDILILNQPDIDEIEDIIQNNLTTGVSNEEFVRKLNEKNSHIKVHIEIGTGMGRTGIYPERTEEFINFVQSCENIEIEGIYTHLSSADIDYDYTQKQLSSFEKSVKIAQEKVKNLKYIHSEASNGIIYFPSNEYNLVRPGMLMYGYSSGQGVLEKIDLKPVCKLKSKITLLKTVSAGTSIGYSRSFITSRETKVATVPIGYADGLRREMSNGGKVLICGKKVPIIGKVCMDSFMADVTDIDDVKLGDDVWIWDNENITLEELSDRCNTINYEILSTITSRVPRVFIEN